MASLTLSLSPHYYFMRGFIKRIFLFPYNLCCPDVASERYINAMRDYQIRPEGNVEEHIEMELVNQQNHIENNVKYGDLDLRDLNKDMLMIKDKLFRGEQVDPWKLKLKVRESEPDDLKNAKSDGAIICVVNPNSDFTF